jgi:hypothetical protein
MYNIPKLQISLYLAFIVPISTLAQNKNGIILAAEIEPTFLYLSNYGAVGPVKSVHVSIYFVNRHSTDIDSVSISKTIDQIFDENGRNRYEKITDYYRGKVERTEVLTYEGDKCNSIYYKEDSSYYRREQWTKIGKRKSVKHTSYNPFTDSIDTEDEIFIRRRRGKLLIVKEVHDKHDLREVRTTRFTRKHQPLVQKVETYNEVWLEKVWTYSANMVLLADTTFHLKKGKTTDMYIVSYDANGNVIERGGWCYEYNHAKSRQTYVYDSNNSEVEHYQYRADGSLELWGRLVYDAHGNLTSDTGYDSDSLAHSQNLFIYNEFNQMTSATLWGRGLADTIRYTRKWEGMDKYDNWQKVTEYKNGEPMLITIRTIEYYK